MEQGESRVEGGASSEGEKEEFPASQSPVDAIFELEVFVELCWAGLGYAQAASQVVEVLDQATKDGTVVGKTARDKRARKLEAFAAAQQPSFPYLYQLAVSRLWSILEAHMQGMFVYVVRTNSAVRNLPRIQDLKGPLIEFADASETRQAELLFTMLSEKVGAPFKPGVGRFEEVLNCVGLGGPVDENARRLLLEACEIRNVVVHRRGIADSRLVAACPWGGFSVGESVHIHPSRFRAYVAATQWYVTEVSKRTLERYPPPNPEKYATIEAHKELLATISTGLQRMANDVQQRPATPP